jgi:hypothetical protein
MNDVAENDRFAASRGDDLTAHGFQRRAVSIDVSDDGRSVNASMLIRVRHFPAPSRAAAMAVTTGHKKGRKQITPDLIEN